MIKPAGEIGFVYLVKTNLWKHLKIGKTVNTIESRMDDFLPSFPMPIGVKTTKLHEITVYDPRIIEDAIHRELSAFRADGEWFDIPEEKAIAVMNRYADKYGPGLKPHPVFMTKKYVNGVRANIQMYSTDRELRETNDRLTVSFKFETYNDGTLYRVNSPTGIRSEFVNLLTPSDNGKKFHLFIGTDFTLTERALTYDRNAWKALVGRYSFVMGGKNFRCEIVDVTFYSHEQVMGQIAAQYTDRAANVVIHDFQNTNVGTSTVYQSDLNVSKPVAKGSVQSDHHTTYVLPSTLSRHIKAAENMIGSNVDLVVCVRSDETFTNSLPSNIDKVPIIYTNDPLEFIRALAKLRKRDGY